MTIIFPESFNMAAYFLDQRIEEGRGERIAVYYEDERYTYADVQRRANRLGNVLPNLGVEMEDRVLIVLPDSIEFVDAWFAIAKIGAVIAMVNSILSSRSGNNPRSGLPFSAVKNSSPLHFALSLWRRKLLLCSI